MTTEIAVVGGGVVGASLCWALSEAGHELTWFTGRDDASSATLAAGAMLAVHSEVAAHEDPDVVAVDVAARSRGRALWDEWLPALHEATGTEVELRPGIHVIAHSPDDVAALEAIRSSAASLGDKAHTVDPHDVPGLHADLSTAAIDAVLLPGEATVDTHELLGALRAALAARPSVTLVTADVVRVDASATGVAVHTPDGVIAAGQVVLAAGAGTSAVLERSGLRGVLPPLLAGRGVSLVAANAPTPDTCLRTPNRAFACGWHLVPRAGGRVYLGATNRLTTRPEPGTRPSLSEISDVIDGCARHLDTRLSRAELVEARVGFRPVTFDRRPLVGRTSQPNVLVATATWRNGVVLAPALAELVTAEVAAPGATTGHAFDVARPVVAAPIDADTVARATRGLVETLIGSAALPPGREAELGRFVANALRRQLDNPDRIAARLLDMAPMEEVLPLLYDLLARG